MFSKPLFKQSVKANWTMWVAVTAGMCVILTTINLIMVATKRDIPFIESNITFESVLKWIYAIPADERAAWREAIVIQ